ncbi:MAG: hypothetical protein J6A58_10595 [Oscillospiraceae bacterium]|nr:hypothetical protein [Oscillospiraceae bacterium]
MKKFRNVFASFLATLMISGAALKTTDIYATTKEDVVAAARSAGFSEVYIQQGINFLESGSYTSEQYDAMIAALYSYAGMTDSEIQNYLDNAGIQVEIPSESTPPEETAPPQVTEPAINEQAPDNQPSQDEPSAPVVSKPQTPVAPAVPENSASQNNTTTKKDFSSLTDEEKKAYISGLTQAQKNQIIKDLDRDTQLEIINKLIDASSELGMFVTVDDLSDDTLKYSIRNGEGDIVDISAIGVVVDDTGIDYTVLVISMALIILLSVTGITAFAFLQKKNG